MRLTRFGGRVGHAAMPSRSGRGRGSWPVRPACRWLIAVPSEDQVAFPVADLAAVIDLDGSVVREPHVLESC